MFLISKGRCEVSIMEKVKPPAVSQALSPALSTSAMSLSSVSSAGTIGTGADAGADDANSPAPSESASVAVGSGEEQQQRSEKLVVNANADRSVNVNEDRSVNANADRSVNVTADRSTAGPANFGKSPKPVSRRPTLVIEGMWMWLRNCTGRNQQLC